MSHESHLFTGYQPNKGDDIIPANCGTSVQPPKQNVIKGVSPDTEIVTNERGGKQSKVEYGFHLIDKAAILKLAEVLQYGASRYARDNWRKIPSEEHFNHMQIHYYAWLSGDTSDDHLGHFFCRAMMLYATAITEDMPELNPYKASEEKNNLNTKERGDKL